MNLTETTTGAEWSRDFRLIIACGAASGLPLNPLLQAGLLVDFSIFAILNPWVVLEIFDHDCAFFRAWLLMGQNKTISLMDITVRFLSMRAPSRTREFFPDDGLMTVGMRLRRRLELELNAKRAAKATRR
jgi:hypothetical protein